MFHDAAFDKCSDSKSHSGIVVFVGNCGCAMYAGSNKQHCILRSSTDDEIISAESGQLIGCYYRECCWSWAMIVPWIITKTTTVVYAWLIRVHMPKTRRNQQSTWIFQWVCNRGYDCGWIDKRLVWYCVYKAQRRNTWMENCSCKVRACRHDVMILGVCWFECVLYMT